MVRTDKYPRKRNRALPFWCFPFGAQKRCKKRKTAVTKQSHGQPPQNSKFSRQPCTKLECRTETGGVAGKAATLAATSGDQAPDLGRWQERQQHWRNYMRDVTRAWCGVGPLATQAHEGGMQKRRKHIREGCKSDAST